MSIPETHEEHPFNLIPELCRLFYSLGWATGTGGGISIRLDDKYYVAPSGVQKERIKPDDIFVLDANAKVVEMPRNKNVVKMSECTPLFFNAFTMRNAGACLHSHSKNAVLVTLLHKKEFRISHMEMIKGITNPILKKAMGFTNTLVVPIIENTNFESDLTASMAACMQAYPETNAVLVRRHGIYVWGDTWQRAKGMMECLDYLFGLSLQMKEFHIPLVMDD
ncbi:methylthioribulose 1-phosphate dehydratase [Trypanosoma theileri]|uniref:Probable methylthioribulose-1-phosphate dehydratase n=1 Tax=Trypanosoma theileri TaxID=67003 RepID=A0A1X0NQV1_9TRYP|nr:methylthioribulose 1-phosphate dehydratase [Trypanosoma theileri]ORC87095.1 methylthioribulose 1-phosphate dehydratase [Trypanosoma theileri]